MLTAFRSQHPEYNDMPDADLMAALHRKFYSDMPYNQFAAQLTERRNVNAEKGTEEAGYADGRQDAEGDADEGMQVGRPDHEDLDNCAVRGADSLELQEIAPEVKPAVKMTVAEFMGAQIPPAKPFFSPGNGTVYVFAKSTPELESAIVDILSGDDSEILGYPEKGPLDAAVTKQGNVVMNLPEMRQHAENGNVAWAANGEEEPLMQKAMGVSRAIRGQRGNL